MDGRGGFKVQEFAMHEDGNALDLKQSASAAQFNRQSDRYGKSHILADTQDVEHGLHGVLLPPGGTALDVATGGGHPALWLTRHGWKTEEWLHRVEKWRDPSHGRFLSRKAWRDLAEKAGLKVARSDLQSRKQPDLNWYFDTAATSEENREKVLEAVAKASEHVRAALRLGNEDGKIVWWWPRLALLACKG